MEQQTGDWGGRRCRPGDLAQVIYSTNPLLVGRLVLVERWGEQDRWDVTLLGESGFGLEFDTGRPLIGHKTAFRDASLRPLHEGSGLAENLVRLEASTAGR